MPFFEGLGPVDVQRGQKQTPEEMDLNPWGDTGIANGGSIVPPLLSGAGQTTAAGLACHAYVPSTVRHAHYYGSPYPYGPPGAQTSVTQPFDFPRTYPPLDPCVPISCLVSILHSGLQLFY